MKAALFWKAPPIQVRTAKAAHASSTSKGVDAPRCAAMGPTQCRLTGKPFSYRRSWYSSQSLNPHENKTESGDVSLEPLDIHETESGLIGCFATPFGSASACAFLMATACCHICSCFLPSHAARVGQGPSSGAAECAHVCQACWFHGWRLSKLGWIL